MMDTESEDNADMKIGSFMKKIDVFYEVFYVVNFAAAIVTVFELIIIHYYIL